MAVSILSGSTFNSFAKSLGSYLSSLSLVFVSEMLSGFFVLFSFGAMPVIRSYLRLHRRDVGWLLIVALMSGVLGPLLLFKGISLTSAVNVGFFFKTELIFLLILSHVVLKEKITSAHFAAIGFVVVGIVIISLKGLTEGITMRFGDIFIMVSSLCYALGSIVFRSKLKNVEPHIALFSRSFVAVSIFFLISPFLSHPFIEEIKGLTLSVIPVLIGFAFVSRFLNSVTYYVALEHLPVSSVSLFGTLDIVGSTLFAFLYLGEQIEWYHVAGGFFIIAGTILLEILGTHPNEQKLEQHLRHRAR